MGAANFDYPIQRAVFEGENGYAKMFEPDKYSMRSQDLAPAFHDAGQFYLWKSDALRKQKVLTNSNVRLQLLDRRRVIDIDTHEDFEVAEEKLNLFNKNEKFRAWSFR